MYRPAPPPWLQVGQANVLRAPMPGVVKSLMCGPGDAVEEGSTLVTLEAMKMQNPLFAPKTGVVSGSYVGSGTAAPYQS